MSVDFYYALHFFGILLTFMSLGSLFMVARAPGDGTREAKRFPTILHGVGLTLVLVGGFGLLAKLEMGFPGYVQAKLVIWLVLGGIVAVFLRAPRLAMACWWVIAILGGVAGYLAFTNDPVV